MTRKEWKTVKVGDVLEFEVTIVVFTRFESRWIPCTISKLDGYWARVDAVLPGEFSYSRIYRPADWIHRSCMRPYAVSSQLYDKVKSNDSEGMARR